MSPLIQLGIGTVVSTFSSFSVSFVVGDCLQYCLFIGLESSLETQSTHLIDETSIQMNEARHHGLPLMNHFSHPILPNSV